MKIAFTGWRGYVGARCVQALKAAGFEVVPLAHRLGEPLAPDALRGVDVLVHCAYQFGLDPDEVRRVNVEGSRALIAAGAPRVVFISSVAAFDGCASVYGQGKLAVEKMVLDAGGVALRVGLVWDEQAGGMIGGLRRLAHMPIVPLPSGGRQPLWLVHLDDVAASVVAAVRDPSIKGIVSVAQAHSITFRELLARVAQRPSPTISFPGRLGIFGLKTLEALGIRLPRFRADSFVSLLNGCAQLDFSQTNRLGVDFRSF